MTFQPDDLLFVSRGGSGFKTKYDDLKSDILGSFISPHDGVYVGDTAPADPFEGDLWWDPDKEEMRIYVAKETEGVVTVLGVRAGGHGYSAASDVPTTGGSGNDLTVTLTVDKWNQIERATVSSGGHGYKVGDVISPIQSGGSLSTLQIQTVNSVATGIWQVAGYNLSNLDEVT